MYSNATAYRAIVRHLRVQRKRLLKLRTELRAMGVEPAEIERVLEPLKTTCRELAEEIRQFDLARAQRGHVKRRRRRRATASSACNSDRD